MCAIAGRSPIGTSGFAHHDDSGARRVPSPADRISVATTSASVGELRKPVPTLAKVGRRGPVRVRARARCGIGSIGMARPHVARGGRHRGRVQHRRERRLRLPIDRDRPLPGGPLVPRQLQPPEPDPRRRPRHGVHPLLPGPVPARPRHVGSAQQQPSRLVRHGDSQRRQSGQRRARRRRRCGRPLQPDHRAAELPGLHLPQPGRTPERTPAHAPAPRAASDRRAGSTAAPPWSSRTRPTAARRSPPAAEPRRSAPTAVSVCRSRRGPRAPRPRRSTSARWRPIARARPRTPCAASSTATRRA